MAGNDIFLVANGISGLGEGTFDFSNGLTGSGYSPDGNTQVLEKHDWLYYDDMKNRVENWIRADPIHNIAYVAWWFAMTTGNYTVWLHKCRDDTGPQYGEHRGDHRVIMDERFKFFNQFPGVSRRGSLHNDNGLLIKNLAAAAYHSYLQDGNEYVEWLAGEADSNNDVGVGWAFYRTRATSGPLHNKTILAFRGTHDARDYSTDATLIFPTGNIEHIINKACNFTRMRNPDYICGHSLGGLVAQGVCTHMGKPGASFNGVGPFSVLPMYNFSNGTKHYGVKFDCWCTEGDTVISTVCGISGVEYASIGSVRWLKKHPDWGNHTMDGVCLNLEKRFPGK